MAGEIGFTPTEKDYVDATRDWYLGHLRSRAARRPRIFLILFCAAMGALMASFDGDAVEMAIGAVGTALFGLLLLGLIYIVCYLTLPGRAARLYRQQKSLQQPWLYRWSEDDLKLETANGLMTYPWADFHRRHEGRTTLLFFLNDHFFLYLPKRLVDGAVAEELRSHAAGAGVAQL